MLGRNSGQIDVFSHMIYDRLIAKDHLLVKIPSVMDFSFVYDKIKDRYSSMGRASKDQMYRWLRESKQIWLLDGSSA